MQWKLSKYQIMKITIIIPVYKVEIYVKECILSVINQTYDNIECIIVDDCSTDKSMQIVYELLNNYSGCIDFKIIIHKKNAGLSAARNSGIRAATGKFVLFLDSDDLLPDKNAVSELVKTSEVYSYPDIVIGSFSTVGGNINIPTKQLSAEYISGNEAIYSSFIQYFWPQMAWNKLVATDLILSNQLYFQENLLHEDDLWSYQLALKAHSLAFCKKNTYCYRIRENSITTNKKIKNFADNLYCCNYIMHNHPDIKKKNVRIFIQAKITMIIFEMYTNTIDKSEILKFRRDINANYPTYPIISLSKRNMITLTKLPAFWLPFKLALRYIHFYNLILK